MLKKYKIGQSATKRLYKTKAHRLVEIRRKSESFETPDIIFYAIWNIIKI